MKFVFIVEEMKVTCLKSKGFGAAQMYTWYDLVYYIINYMHFFVFIWYIIYVHDIRMQYLHTVNGPSHVSKLNNSVFFLNLSE